MAKKVIGELKLQLPAGKATPAPPVGPALGQRGNPRDQLWELKRLGKVVVRAEVKARQPVVERPRGGQHDHPRSRVGIDDPAADVVAVDTGQVPVQHEDVGADLVD